ncbi:N-acetylglucosamine-6-phosphate deacetylase [Kribbella sp. NPDC058693]|uniref:N-acetylglucosamine-6-phosphate deacetylase n=1 Tax=Kribbella sp. NPDC058693 TaxID=3346602 RepID=UPI003648BE62
MTTFVNAHLCTPEPVHGWLQVENGRIVAIGPGMPPETPAGAGYAGTGGEEEMGTAQQAGARADDQAGGRADDQAVVDARGRWLVPGFVDTHCHGGGGAALYSGEVADVLLAARSHLEHATTSLVASVATMRLDRMVRAAEAIAEAGAPNIRGIHLEGPFLSQRRRGAQTADALLEPDEEVFGELIAAAGGLAVSMTIAPELPGAIELVERHRDEITFAVGHTDDDGTWTRRAFDAGARTATHLFNAMPPMTHRQPGPVGAALTDDRVACELIADGIHLSPEALTVATRTAGLDRAMLVTDAMAATGLGDGNYSYADRHVHVHDGIATLRGTDTLAGSVHFLADALATAVRVLKLTVPQAVQLVATNAAHHYGWHDRGTLAVGNVADLVLLSQDLTVEAVYLAGTEVS